MDLAGWITLRNLTGATFRDAQVQLVAGRLNLLDVEEGGTSTMGATADYFDESMDEARATTASRRCSRNTLEEPEDVRVFRRLLPARHHADSAHRPIPRSMQSWRRTWELSGTQPAKNSKRSSSPAFARSMVLREKLADYQMYRPPIATDLNARQTKQVAFLHKPDVVVDRFYSLRIETEMNYDPMFLDEDNDLFPLGIKVAWRNGESDGLGEPLPAGQVRFFEQAGKRRCVRR